MSLKTINRAFTYPIELKAFLLLILITFNCSSLSFASEPQDKRKGVYQGGKKNWNIFKSRKKFKHIKKRSKRKKLSASDNTKRKINRQKQKTLGKLNKKSNTYKRNGKVKLKKTKLGRSGSLYSYSKKKNKKIKGRKGRFPKSKTELNSKLTVHISSGVIATQSNENIDDSNTIIDVYSNYRPSAHLTAGLLYNYNSKVSLGADVRLFRLQSNEESESDNVDLKLNSYSIGLHIKYNILPSSSNFNPYVTFGPTFSFTRISQEENIIQINNTDSSNSIANETVLIPSFKTPVIPLYGIKLAIGADFKFNNKISGFIQADLDFSSSKNKRKIQEYFNKNKSDFIFYGINFGIRYNLFQKTSLY